MEDEKIITKEELKRAGKPKKSFPFIALFFAIVIIFFGVQGYLLLKHHHVSAYNVQTPTYDNVTGSIRGVVLRSESTLTANASGYVTLYKQDGDYVSKGDTILLESQDEKMAEQIREVASQNSFSSESIKKISGILEEGISELDTEDFDTVLELKSNTQEIIFSRLLTDNENFANYLNTVSVSRETASESGFYMSWTDGWESLSATDLTSAMLSGEDYHKTSLRSGDEIKAGSAAGKLAVDNCFELVFLIDDDSYSTYSKKTQLTISTTEGLEITGSFTTAETQDGKHIGILSFQKYGSYFLSERFVNFAVLDKEVYGYKIPESAIIEKTFFVIPETFLTTGGEGDSDWGVMVEQGDNTANFVECTVYRKSSSEVDSIVKEEGYCYIYSDQIKRGDVIHNRNTDDSGEKFMTIGQEVPVEGVYLVNAGYCVFKPIVRIQNSLDTAFVMISSKSTGTVRAYDRILLNASEFSENEFLFE